MCEKLEQLEAIFFKGETLPGEQGHLFQRNKGTKVEKHGNNFGSMGNQGFYFGEQRKKNVLYFKWWKFLFENKKHILLDVLMFPLLSLKHFPYDCFYSWGCDSNFEQKGGMAKWKFVMQIRKRLKRINIAKIFDQN